MQAITACSARMTLQKFLQAFEGLVVLTHFLTTRAVVPPPIGGRLGGGLIESVYLNSAPSHPPPDGGRGTPVALACMR